MAGSRSTGKSRNVTTGKAGASTRRSGASTDRYTKSSGASTRYTHDTNALEQLGIEHSLAQWLVKATPRKDAEALTRRAARQVVAQLEAQGKLTVRSVRALLPKLPKKVGAEVKAMAEVE
jgi:hypothetical protein